MMAAKILVVDDESQIRELVRLYLEREGYTVIACGDGPSAMAAATDQAPDLMILDLMLPGVDGQEVCRRLREQGSTLPVIMLTARTTERDKLSGLRGGADDYVTKPFSPAELVARVGAVLRRARAAEAEEPPALRAGPVEVDERIHEVRVNAQPIALTPTEFRLLGALVREPGRAFTRAQLLDLALGPDFEGFDRNVDVHVMNLRRKLGLSPSPIRTVYGVGYKLEVPDGRRA